MSAIAMCILCGVAVAACQLPSVAGPGSDETATPSPTMPAAAPTEASDTSPSSPADARAAKLVTLATEHLAARIDTTPEQIALVRVTSVEWRDGSLGCPEPNVDYIQRVTPGYEIWLQAGEDVYEYHTDDSSRVVLCGVR